MSRFLQSLIIIIFFCLLITACNIKGFMIPKWEVKLKVPLINESYPLLDLYFSENNENIGVDEDEAGNPNSIYFYTEDDLKVADIGSNELKISPNHTGVGPIPVIISFSESLSLTDGDDDDVSVAIGKISSGELIFRFETLPENVNEIQISVNELFDANDKRVSLEIPKQNHSFEYRYDLRNHELKHLENEEIVEALSFAVKIVHSGTIVNPGGYMRIYHDQPIIFSKVHGYLNNFRVNVDYTEKMIDMAYPLNIENAIDLNDPSLIFSIYNHLGFETVFSGIVTAHNTRNGTMFTIDLEDIDIAKRRIRATTEGDSLLTTLTFTKDDGIGSLINIAPDLIEVRNAFFIVNNPENGFGFANAGRSMGVGYIAKVPFDFKFYPNQRVRPDELESATISKSNRDEIKDSAQNAEINLSMKNYFSVGARVRLYICSSDNDELVFVEENVKEENFQRLVFLYTDENEPISMPRGTHLIPTEETFTFIVSKDDLSMFYDFERIFLGVEIEFEEGESIIHPLEKIEISGNLIADILVDLNKNEGEAE